MIILSIYNFLAHSHRLHQFSLSKSHPAYIPYLRRKIQTSSSMSRIFLCPSRRNFGIFCHSYLNIFSLFRTTLCILLSQSFHVLWIWIASSPSISNRKTLLRLLLTFFPQHSSLCRNRTNKCTWGA